MATSLNAVVINAGLQKWGRGMLNSFKSLSSAEQTTVTRSLLCQWLEVGQRQALPQYQVHKILRTYFEILSYHKRSDLIRYSVKAIVQNRSLLSGEDRGDSINEHGDLSKYSLLLRVGVDAIRNAAAVDTDGAKQFQGQVRDIIGIFQQYQPLSVNIRVRERVSLVQALVQNVTRMQHITTLDQVKLVNVTMDMMDINDFTDFNAATLAKLVDIRLSVNQDLLSKEDRVMNKQLVRCALERSKCTDSSALTSSLINHIDVVDKSLPRVKDSQGLVHPVLRVLSSPQQLRSSQIQYTLISSMVQKNQLPLALKLIELGSSVNLSTHQRILSELPLSQTQTLQLLQQLDREYLVVDERNSHVYYDYLARLRLNSHASVIPARITSKLIQALHMVQSNLECDDGLSKRAHRKQVHFLQNSIYLGSQICSQFPIDRDLQQDFGGCRNAQRRLVGWKLLYSTFDLAGKFNIDLNHNDWYSKAISKAFKSK
ncbi:hypothetical protein MP228_002322 [Amoeboaphelidium protococcarum]|nr:hypothetical protein MP228_002322 [Amoeboaphelidium protococcarum]